MHRPHADSHTALLVGSMLCLLLVLAFIWSTAPTL